MCRPLMVILWAATAPSDENATAAMKFFFFFVCLFFSSAAAEQVLPQRARRTTEMATSVDFSGSWSRVFMCPRRSASVVLNAAIWRVCDVVGGRLLRLKSGVFCVSLQCVCLHASLLENEMSRGDPQQLDSTALSKVVVSWKGRQWHLIIWYKSKHYSYYKTLTTKDKPNCMPMIFHVCSLFNNCDILELIFADDKHRQLSMQYVNTVCMSLYVGVFRVLFNVSRNICFHSAGCEPNAS